MKECIVLMASIALGVFIYVLVAGSSDSSLLNQMTEVWQQGLDARSFFSE